MFSAMYMFKKERQTSYIATMLSDRPYSLAQYDTKRPGACRMYGETFTTEGYWERSNNDKTQLYSSRFL